MRLRSPSERAGPAGPCHGECSGNKRKPLAGRLPVSLLPRSAAGPSVDRARVVGPSATVRHARMGSCRCGRVGDRLAPAALASRAHRVAAVDGPALTKFALALRPRATGHVAYTIHPTARGDHRIGRVYLRYHGPLRFAERWAVAELDQTLRVYPN